MANTHSEWRDHAWERLRRLEPGEWMLAGELFEEVQTEIPLHLAMRQAMRQSRGKPVPTNKARWVLFTHGLHELGKAQGRSQNIVDREASMPEKPRKWRYHDRIRLRFMAGMQCGKCGKEAMIWLRGVDPRRKNLQHFACQYCDHPIYHTDRQQALAPELSTGEAERLNASQPTASPTPPDVPEVIPGPAPALDPIDLMAASINAVGATVLLTALRPEPPKPKENIPRRIMARMVRALLRGQYSMSLNSIERELAQAKDNAAIVLARHGYRMEEQQRDLMKRNKLLNVIYQHMGQPPP